MRSHFKHKVMWFKDGLVSYICMENHSCLIISPYSKMMMEHNALLHHHYTLPNQFNIYKLSNGQIYAQRLQREYSTALFFKTMDRSIKLEVFNILLDTTIITSTTDVCYFRLISQFIYFYHSLPIQLPHQIPRRSNSVQKSIKKSNKCEIYGNKTTSQFSDLLVCHK